MVVRGKKRGENHVKHAPPYPLKAEHLTTSNLQEQYFKYSIYYLFLVLFPKTYRRIIVIVAIKFLLLESDTFVFCCCNL